MRKFLAVITLAAVLLAGCGSSAEPTETTAPATSGLHHEEVLDNFEKMLEPIADQYEMTRVSNLELDDGSFFHHVKVTNKLLGDSYTLLLYYNWEGDVRTVLLDGERGKRTNLDFAVLSLYVYKSLGLPEIDADDFYDHFNLLTAEPSGSLSVEGWHLSAIRGEGLLTFGASFKPE